jgi:hypothetical protein
MNNVYVCMNNKSAKMWGYTSFENDDDTWEIQYYWGSVGRDMQFLQSKKKTYPNRGVALTTLYGIIEKKKHDGYKTIPNHRYFDLTRNYLLALQEEMDGPGENLPLHMKEALDEALA